MGEKEQRTDQGKRVVSIAAPQPDSPRADSSPAPSSPIYPADLRRLPDEEPAAWLARLRQLPDAGLSLPVQLTRSRFIVHAEEMLRQSREAAEIASEVATRVHPRVPGREFDADEVDLPEPGTARQAVSSTLDQAKAVFRTLSLADKQAFLRWLESQSDEDSDENIEPDTEQDA